MAMNFTQLADEIADAMGYSPTSDKIKAFAHGTVDEVKTGLATFGGTPGPHPISGVTPSDMADLIKSYGGYPSVTSQLLGYCTGVSNHIMLAGQVYYASPPPSTSDPIGWHDDGVILALSGAACALLVAAAAGYPSVSDKLEQECTAVVDHIMNNAEVNWGVIT